MEDGKKEQQKFINFNKSPKGKISFRNELRAWIKSHTNDELRQIVQDVQEYSEDVRKTAASEIANRKNKIRPLKLTDL